MENDVVSQFTAQLIELVRTSPVWLSSLILFVSVFLEYMFPPFPGDTVLVAGGFFIAQGAIPFLPAALALVTGSITGSMAGWYLGRLAKQNARAKAIVFRFFGDANLEKVHQAYERHGSWMLVVNRFLPGIRGFFMIGAGFTGIPFYKVAIYGTLSALIWNALLVSAGFFLSENLAELIDLFRTYSLVILGAVLSLIAIFILRRYLRRGH